MLGKRNKQPEIRKLRRIEYELREIEAELEKHVNEYIFEQTKTGEFLLYQYNSGYYNSSSHLDVNRNLVECCLQVIEALAKAKCTIVEVDPRLACRVSPYEMEEFYEGLWKNWPHTYRSILSRFDNHEALTLLTPEAPMSLLQYYMHYDPMGSMIMHVYEESYSEMMALIGKALATMPDLEEAALIIMYIEENDELTLQFQLTRMPIEQVLAPIEKFMKESKLHLEVKGI